MTRQDQLNEISKMSYIRVAKGNTGRGINDNSNRVEYVKIPAGLYRVAAYKKAGNWVKDVTIKGLDRKGKYNGREYTLIHLYDYDIAEDPKAAERIKRAQCYKPVTGPSPAHLELGRLLVDKRVFAREIYLDGGKPLIQFFTAALERDGSLIVNNHATSKAAAISDLKFCTMYYTGESPKPEYLYYPNDGGHNEVRYSLTLPRDQAERAKRDIQIAVQAYLDQKTAAAKEVLKEAGIND